MLAFLIELVQGFFVNIQEEPVLRCNVKHAMQLRRRTFPSDESFSFYPHFMTTLHTDGQPAGLP
jgi:hypothetical protein